MSWRKHFRAVRTAAPQVKQSTVDGRGDSASNFSSYLPEVYAGNPNRIQRYYQYDDMDRDSDINAALDTIADFCTQSEEQARAPFEIDFDEKINETESKIVSTLLDRWVTINEFGSRLWYVFRNAIKYGDCFFVRDPETSEWLWVDQYNVLLVKVDEENGKTPDEYLIKGLDYNKQAKLASKKADMSQYNTPGGTSQIYSSRPLGGTGSTMSMAGGNMDARSAKQMQPGSQETFVVDAEHVVHLSLSVGMDPNWPFGTSVLEPVFKSFKQKELLEDAVIIYRTQRAPERRIFYIDVGDMDPIRARSYLNQVKNEIHQRRIPNRQGGGSALDAAYNPLSILEDYYFSTSADGRGSKVETLPGGDAVGELADLDHFTRKLARGMRIPTSYLSISDESQTPYNDGRVGTAMIQEYRFNKYCMRLQSLMQPVFDQEFKRFVKENGVIIDPNMFKIHFLPPQNFTKYRQIELDQAQMGVYQMISDNRKLSERFKLKRFLNLTEEEILENERMWREENPERVRKITGSDDAAMDGDAGLSSVGIRGGDDFSFGDDFGGDGGMDMNMDADMGGDLDMGGDPEPPPQG